MDMQLSLFDTNSEYLETKVNDIADITSGFRVHASLIYKLGESLIADDITALSELIKNTYDADATMCVVNIDTQYTETIDGKTCKGLIEIVDNGCGMSLSTIVNGWLTISNSPKKKMKKENKTTEKFHRYPLGDKGLGRLSVQKLGRYMQMSTKTIDSDEEFSLTIPWGSFLTNTTIDQIPVQLTRNQVEQKVSYTKLLIKDLINAESWAKKEQISAIENSISKIVSPFKSTNNNFSVFAKIDGQEIEDVRSIFDELLKAARAKYCFSYTNGIVNIKSNYKKDFFLNRDNLKEVLSRNFTFTETSMEDFLQTLGSKLDTLSFSEESGFLFQSAAENIIENLAVNNEYAYDPGDFDVEIYEYSFDQGYLDYIYNEISLSNFVNKDEFRSFVDRFHGVKVIRDGFIVRGFGEGEEGDWIGLSSSSKTTGSFFDFRNDSVIGCVKLTGLENYQLKETTNREGFVDDEYFKNFKSIIKSGIKTINKQRNKLNSLMRQYIIESTSNIKIDNSSSDYFSSLETIQANFALQSNLPEKIAQYKGDLTTSYNKVSSVEFMDTSVKKEIENIVIATKDLTDAFDFLIDERNQLEKQIEAVKFEFGKIGQRIQDLFELAGLGISVEFFAHEFDSSMKNIRTKNAEILKMPKDKSPDDLLKHIRYVDYSLNVLRKQVSYFNPGLKFVRAEKQEFGMVDFLDTHKSFYQERCDKKNIIFSVISGEDFAVKINRGMLNQVFDNLFNNSEYWLNFSFDKGLISEKRYNIELFSSGVVIVWDNGIGISKDIEKRLFEPFETKKEGGRGLGLYIALSNLKYNLATMHLLQERNEFGNLFKFEIDLSQIKI